jgi:hypothetical protein
MSPPTPPTNHLRFILSRFFLILFGTFVSLVFVEIMLRVFNIHNRYTLVEQLEQQWEADGELLLHLKPNLNLTIVHPEFSYTVRTNESGMRDESFEGTYDIAAIGDSFTFGFGVEEEDTWPTRLETRSGRRVANLGWGGWNSLVYTITLKRYAIPLNTRIWVWAFFGNDLPESAHSEEFINSGQTDYKSWAQERGERQADLAFPFNLRIVQMIPLLTDPMLEPGSGGEIFDNGEMRMLVNKYAWDKTDPTLPEVQRGWELTEEALNQAGELAREEDASLVVVFIPNREHVYWPLIQHMLEGVNISQLDDVAAHLGRICEAADIYYLNLLPGFREQALEGTMLYFPSDGHWNEAGNDLAAMLIYEKLLAEGLLQIQTGD